MRTSGIMISVSLLFLGTACSVQQQNGSDIHLEQPFLLSNQRWEITQKLVTPAGDRICSVSSGEMNVTQHSHNHTIVHQVGTSNPLNPGDHYKILIGPHNYETPEDSFDASQSRAIANDMLASTVVYTETRVLTLESRGPVWRSIDNKIPIANFPSQYQICKTFVQSTNPEQ